MKILQILSLAITFLFVTGTVFAKEGTFRDSALHCGSFNVSTKDGGTYQVQVTILTKKLYQMGSQEAVAVLSYTSGEIISVNSGTLKLTKESTNTDEIWTFSSRSEDMRIKLISEISESQLFLEYKDEGSWSSENVEKGFCERTQYGSEGSHN